MASPIRLYRHPLSGHSHRVELFLSILGVPFEAIDVDLAARAHKQPDFLARNPFGQVPVIEDGDRTVADSNAILVYLAATRDPSGTWLPRDAAAAAEVQRWLSLAAGPLASGPAAARLVNVFGAALDAAAAQRVASQLFARMDEHLSRQSWLAGAEPTIADVALYTYSAHAPEGGVSLVPYPFLRDWLARVEALPGFVPMQRTPVGLPE